MDVTQCKVKGQGRQRRPYWVRVTRANGDQQLWCVNAGYARAKLIYDREVRRADSGDTVEWGPGNGD